MKQHKSGSETQHGSQELLTNPSPQTNLSNASVQDAMSSEGPVPRTEPAVQEFVLEKHPECRKYVTAEKTADPTYDKWIAELKSMKPGDKRANKPRADKIMGDSLKYGTEQRPKEAADLRGMYKTMEKYEGIWQNQLEAEGVPLKERAQLAFMHRNTRKMFTRDLMTDVKAREVLDLRNVALYGSAESQAFDDMVQDKTDMGMSEDEAYRDIIGSARTSSQVANKATGITK